MADDNIRPGSDEPRFYCTVCADDFYIADLITVPCGHNYCVKCLRLHFETTTQDESLFPPHCCDQQIPFIYVLLYLTSGARAAYEHTSREFTTPHRTYCAAPDCGTFIPVDDILDDHARCSKCRSNTCARCKSLSHDGDCNPNSQLEELAQTNNWRRCGRCHALVERSGGCNHMFCCSGHHFRYECEAEYGTCNCRHVFAARRRAAWNRRGLLRPRQEPNPPRVNAGVRERPWLDRLLAFVPRFNLLDRLFSRHRNRSDASHGEHRSESSRRSEIDIALKEYREDLETLESDLARDLAEQLRMLAVRARAIRVEQDRDLPNTDWLNTNFDSARGGPQARWDDIQSQELRDMVGAGSDSVSEGRNAAGLETEPITSQSNDESAFLVEAGHVVDSSDDESIDYYVATPMKVTEVRNLRKERFWLWVRVGLMVLMLAVGISYFWHDLCSFKFCPIWLFVLIFVISIAVALAVAQASQSDAEYGAMYRLDN